MLNDIFTNKWILGSIVFLIMFAVVFGFLYIRDTKINSLIREAKKIKDIANKGEMAEKDANINGKEQLVESVPPMENTTQNTEKKITEKSASSLSQNNSAGPPQGVDSNVSTLKNKKTKRVRTSPHGFGPYPKRPKGAPIARFDDSDSIDMELMLRVAVKAWNEGERFQSGFTDGNTGRVYLNYPGIVYVEYSEEVDDVTGEVKSVVSNVTGGASLSQSVIRSVLDGNTPTGYTLIGMNESGIDPYEYLDLP